MKKAIVGNDAPAPVGPYSHAIEASGVIYCSGQVGLDPASGELAQGLETQVRQALANLSSVLKSAGVSTADVVKTTVFLSSMDDFPAMNEIYAAHFIEPFPARSTVAVKTLPRNALFEIEAVAVAG